MRTGGSVSVPQLMCCGSSTRNERRTPSSKPNWPNRPDSGAAARLAELEREREAWQAERIELSRKVSEYKARRSRADIDATERESQRDVIASLKSQRELLHTAHKELQEEVEGLYRRSEARTPFPACVSMDQDSELQSGQPHETDGLELEAFVEDLQHRIADSQPARLFYALPDLRSFVGGLAMGRLILLQGISGTGKTSLPVAFARATGTQAAEIKVQAGWRDPQDLIGHYNTFEKRFHETEFLKALYQAGTPRWSDTVQIVLLDEMNLSHPEQYFSDLLSTLELPEDDQRLELMTHSVAAAPALLDNGCKLCIPPNVWFVGTANHDETTMNFAPKTYDRSHVMEFPHRPQPFEIDRPLPRQPVSFSALQKAFDAAIQKNVGAVNKAIDFLDSEVRDRLKSDFDVGWGPRLERQMRRYVPVVVAAGGTVGEATDHMLAMRLLRKLQNRHDNRPGRVEALKQRIRESWSTLDKNSEPTRSMALLETELRRLGEEPPHPYPSGDRARPRSPCSPNRPQRASVARVTYRGLGTSHHRRYPSPSNTCRRPGRTMGHLREPSGGSARRRSRRVGAPADCQSTSHPRRRLRPHGEDSRFRLGNPPNPPPRTPDLHALGRGMGQQPRRCRRIHVEAA